MTKHNCNHPLEENNDDDDDNDDEWEQLTLIECVLNTLIDSLQILPYFVFSVYLNTCYETQIPENNGFKSAYMILNLINIIFLPYKILVQQ